MERTRNVSGASLQVDKEPKDHYYVLQCLQLILTLAWSIGKSWEVAGHFFNMDMAISLYCMGDGYSNNVVTKSYIPLKIFDLSNLTIGSPLFNLCTIAVWKKDSFKISGDGQPFKMGDEVKLK